MSAEALLALHREAPRLGIRPTELVLLGDLILYGARRALAAMVETTGLGRRTVQRALDRLQQIEVLTTKTPGRAGAPAAYEIHIPGVVLAPAGCQPDAEVGVNLAPIEPVIDSPAPDFPQDVYIRNAGSARARSNSLSLLSPEREENPPCEKPAETPPAPDPADEIVLFAETVLGHPIDAELERKFRALPAALPDVPLPRICDFVALKCAQKENHDAFTPGALEEFCRKETATCWAEQSRRFAAQVRAGLEVIWKLPAQRKPPGSERRATSYRGGSPALPAAMRAAAGGY